MAKEIRARRRGNEKDLGKKEEIQARNRRGGLDNR